MSDQFDVAVVGGGVVGLTTAITLLDSGRRVLVISADEAGDTVSSVAAAVWYPTGTTDDDPRVLTWATDGFDTLTDQAGQGVPGVAMRPTRMLLREETPTPWWAPAVRDLQTIIVDDGTLLSAQPSAQPYFQEWRFTVPSVEMTPYLAWLEARVGELGGVIERRRLDRLDQLAPVVVNAAGLAGGVLAGDPGMRAIRGRVVLVANPGIHTSVRDEDNPAGMTYIHPRSRDVVLGGTFEPMSPDVTPDLTPDPVESAAIIERCTALVPELAGAEVLRTAAGLRPGRVGGARVEADPKPLAGGARVIHNYGHGGAGVTLSWGCAREVLRALR